MGETIDATALSESDRLSLAMQFINGEGGINDMISFTSDIKSGEVEVQSKKIQKHGESRADALGRGYRLRDTIERETDLSASCDLTGKAWEFPEKTYYEMVMTIEE